MPRPIAEQGDAFLTRKEACELLGMDGKIFDNYFKVADEFKCQPRPGGKGMFYFSRRELEAWKESYDWRCVELTLSDYSLCLDFALAMHDRGYVVADWGTGRQREFGQKITNWVKGQLGEVALKKFLQAQFDVSVGLDFEIHKKIVPQDIIKVTKDGELRNPRVGVGIKSSKPKSAFLVLGKNEYHIPTRRSDYYIFCRPHIPDDHLLRLTRDKIIQVVSEQPHFSIYRDHMPEFANIPCEIAGWCRIEELEEVRGIPGQDFDEEGGARYVRKSGQLRKNRASWEELIAAL